MESVGSIARVEAHGLLASAATYSAPLQLCSDGFVPSATSKRFMRRISLSWQGEFVKPVVRLRHIRFRNHDRTLSSFTATVEPQDLLPSEHEESPARELSNETSTGADYSISDGRERTWFAFGMVLSASLGIQCSSVMTAMAIEAGSSYQPSSETAEAVSRAPSWLSPTILAFPVVSYFLFTIYRDKVDPSVKVTDWMFGLVALGIVANIVMQATWGVRLY